MQARATPDAPACGTLETTHTLNRANSVTDASPIIATALRTRNAPATIAANDADWKAVVRVMIGPLNR